MMRPKLFEKETMQFRQDTLLYVSTLGNDEWAGRLPEPLPDGSDGPLRTLDGARRAVQSLLCRADDGGDIRVLIRSGKYPVRGTVVFGLSDSGLDEKRIHYEAYPMECPVFTAGVPVTGWRRLDYPVDGLPNAAEGKVWVADMPTDIKRFHVLYENGLPLKRARGKGFTPTVSGHWQDEECWTLGARTRLHFPNGALRSWKNIRDVEIVIRPWCLWTMNILPLASVDEKNGVAETAVEGSYFLTRERYHRFPEESVWPENIPEGMTGPGCWMVNTSNRKIYLWPTGDCPPERITTPCLRELIRVEGEILEDGTEDRLVRYLSFKGLSFVEGDRDLWTLGHKGVQHDLEMWDEGNALLTGVVPAEISAIKSAYRQLNDNPDDNMCFVIKWQ